MDGRIRRCTPADGAALAVIYDPIVAQTAISFETLAPDAAGMRERIASAGERYPWLAFERAGSVLGYVYASQHRARDAYRWSVDVSAYVHSEARGNGIASSLYLKLFEVLQAQGYCAAFAGVVLPNAASIRLHQSVGFSEVGIYRRVGFKFGQWHDVQWFERSLNRTEHPAEPCGLDELHRADLQI